MGVLDTDDRVLVVDGGSFGHRFVELCDLHGIPFTRIALDHGEPLREEDLSPYEDGGYTAFLVNIHETSTGVLYDSDLIGEFCRRNELLLVVDAISSFLADPLDMEKMGAQVVIAGSQKALACPPGISLCALGPMALERVNRIEPKTLYLSLRLLLKDGERGQTPFTPAVGTLLQMYARLREASALGVAEEVARVGALACDFRTKAADLPFELNLCSPSNAATYVRTGHYSALGIVESLKRDHGIWVCPNGGNAADSSFRVGHIGDLSTRDNDVLIDALKLVLRSFAE